MVINKHLIIFAATKNNLIFSVMAKRKANGEFSGLVGNIVLYERKGEQHMRVRPKKRIDKSASLLKSQAEFRNLMFLIKKFKILINTGFADHTKNRSAYHSALSVNRNNFVTAKNEGNTGNIGWFQYSDGSLSGALDVSAVRTADGKIEISWSGYQDGLSANESDIATACIFINDTKELIIGPENITRESGSAIIDPRKKSIEGSVECFLSFAVNTRRYKVGSTENVSKSQWIGVIC